MENIAREELRNRENNDYNNNEKNEKEDSKKEKLITKNLDNGYIESEEQKKIKTKHIKHYSKIEIIRK